MDLENKRKIQLQLACLITPGKKLSYLLRHDKSYAFDEHGWRGVSDLVANHSFTFEELREIVATNNKKKHMTFSDSNNLTESTKDYSDILRITQNKSSTFFDTD